MKARRDMRQIFPSVFFELLRVPASPEPAQKLFHILRWTDLNARHQRRPICYGPCSNPRRKVQHCVQKKKKSK